jgi:hypothetical protein
MSHTLGYPVGADNQPKRCKTTSLANNQPLDSNQQAPMLLCVSCNICIVPLPQIQSHRVAIAGCHKSAWLFQKDLIDKLGQCAVMQQPLNNKCSYRMLRAFLGPRSSCHNVMPGKQGKLYKAALVTYCADIPTLAGHTQQPNKPDRRGPKAKPHTNVRQTKQPGIRSQLVEPSTFSSSWTSPSRHDMLGCPRCRPPRVSTKPPSPPK